MSYDYDAYCARFDLDTTAGARDMLRSSVSDWRDGDISDEALDDLVARVVSAIGGHVPKFAPSMTRRFDYSSYCDRFDLSDRDGAASLLGTALRDWRGDRVTDLEFDDLMNRVITVLNRILQDTPA